MIRRLAAYFASFLSAFAVWMSFAFAEAVNPFLPYQYPGLAFFMGIGFPGGATPELHYLNHVAETWFPFLTAFLTAKILTKSRARFLGSLITYGAFLVWSLVMVWLDRQGVSINTIFGLGLAGTFFGGAVLYLWLIDPKRPSLEAHEMQS